MKIGVGGKAAELRCADERKLESVAKIHIWGRGMDNTTSAGWKGSITVDLSLLHRGQEDGNFKDLGRLLFWMSHAVLEVEDDKIQYITMKKGEVGQLTPFVPYQAPKLSCIDSFIHSSIAQAQLQ
ncbi:hypothetical protein F4811DRAFT_540275 [Daldinia bambusicola]|nr:hypothetical protein F4811DRAFT_540275 [Daldinia bambusicola]